MATFFVLLSSKRRCRLCLDPFFSCPPTSTLFVERGPSPPPLSLYREDAGGGGEAVVVSSKLNLNCKFSSSPQKIVLSNILIACILTKLLLIQNRSKTIQDGAAFFFFLFFSKKGCFKM